MARRNVRRGADIISTHDITTSTKRASASKKSAGKLRVRSAYKVLEEQPYATKAVLGKQSEVAKLRHQLIDSIDINDPDTHRCTEVGLWLMRAIRAGRITISSIVDVTFRDGVVAKIILPMYLLPDLIRFNAYTNGEDLDGKAMGVYLERWSDKAKLQNEREQLAPYKGDPAAIQETMRRINEEIAQFKAKVATWLDGFDPSQLEPYRDDAWAKNLDALTKTLALNSTEASILRYAVLTQMNGILSRIEVSGIGGLYIMCSASDHCGMLGDILNIDPTEIRAALMPSRILTRSSLITFKYHDSGSTSLSIDETILNSILTGTPDTLFSVAFARASGTKLSEADFQYCSDQTSVLKTYLRYCVDNKQVGTNVLLYGRPGVGKSELAKVMADALGVPLYQIAEENDDKSAKDREDRLAAYCLTQEVLHNGPSALVLFDEVEDIFAAPESEASSAQKAKGFVNRLLEENAVPTFWITNSCHHMDAAVLRRFDLVMHMTIPPRDTRLKIAQNYFRDVGAPPSYLLDVNLTAADFARISKVATVLKQSGADMPDGCVGTLAMEYLKLFDAQHKVLPVYAGFEPTFDPTLCTAKVDLDALERSLRRRGAAVLLTGPVGSGKAATAKYLGDKLGLVVDKSATELLGMGPYQTISNIRSYVDSLRREGAVGLIENLDIMVNLTRDSNTENTIITDGLADLLSRHTGTIFVCCSEPPQRLPVALLNCFSVKLEFETLTGAQCQQYCALACQVSTDRFSNGLSRKAQGLAGLVPQAFVNVLRRADLLGHDVTPEYLLAELEKEYELSRDGGRRAGF